MSVIRKALVFSVLISVYGFTWLVAAIGRRIPRRSWKPTGRIMVTGTFHNPNWYLSHVAPLARSGVEEVILVVDKPQIPLDNVRFVCPPKWIARVLGRAGAKAIWMIIAGIRDRPDLYMGYYIAPGACTALVVGRLFGRPACYQMTGGPVEIVGGGFQDVEGIGRFLKQPSTLIENMALGVVRSFELVVVRGARAKECLAAHKITGSVEIITGSINACAHSSRIDREIHLVFVGRLAPVKQIDQFISIVEATARVIPSVKAVIVGDGPLMESLRAEVGRLKLANNVEFLGKRKDVQGILANSRVFVLTSQSEGLSIAMAEAMAAGAVPVVADVGDLRDLVSDGVCGYLIRPDCIGEYSRKVVSLLQDPVLWKTFSRRAIEAASSCQVETVSAKWGQCLCEVVSRASGQRFLGRRRESRPTNTMTLLSKDRQ